MNSMINEDLLNNTTLSDEELIIKNDLEKELIGEIKKTDDTIDDELQSNVIIDIDELDSELKKEIDAQLSELKILEENKEKIGNPATLGEIIRDVVWEQFINQLGVVAGEEFIQENRGLKLDLSDNAHIQTTNNFAKGDLATHNTEIDYKQRYDAWQSNFVRDKDGNIVMRYDRIDNEDKVVLVAGARSPFDKGRPKGSASEHMDHTVSTGEIIRDPKANAHLPKEKQLEFANSSKNLNPLDSGANESKGDHKMENWIESERDGKKPAERFNIDEKQLKEKDKEARAEYEKLKEEGEKKSIEAGRKSQMAEGFRIGGKALQTFVMVLLADLVKRIIQQLIIWLRSAEKSLNTFLESVKVAITKFIENLKQVALSATDMAMTTIVTAILGPIVGLIKKAWILIKQSANTIKQAIEYLKNPQNMNKDFAIIMIEVGRIVIVGLSAAGAIVLSEAIEKALSSIPFFALGIPVIGSLANIFGIFLGALISGIIGALALRMIDSIAAKHQLNKIRTQEDELYTQLTQKKALLADVVTVKTGINILQTETVVVETTSNIIGKREKTIQNQEETRDTLVKTEETINVISEKIRSLKNNEEDTDI